MGSLREFEVSGGPLKQQTPGPLNVLLCLKKVDLPTQQHVTEQGCLLLFSLLIQVTYYLLKSMPAKPVTAIGCPNDTSQSITML